MNSAIDHPLDLRGRLSFLLLALFLAQLSALPVAYGAKNLLSAPKGANLTTTASAPLAKDMDPAAVVGRAGSFKVTVGEYHQVLAEMSQANPAMFRDKPKPELGRRLIEGLLLNKAKADAAKKKGAGKSAEYQVALRMMKLRALAQTAMEQQKPGKLKDPTDQELQKAYDKMAEEAQKNKQVLFNFIFFKTLNLDQAQKAEKRKKAEQALARARGGEDFLKVMKQVSEAQEIKEKPIRISATTPHFNAKLFGQLSAMKPGTISDIIETKAGLNIFHIIPQPERKLKPFPEMLADPKGREELAARSRALAGPSAPPMQELLDRLKAQYPPRNAYQVKEGQKALPPDAAMLAQVGDGSFTMGDLRNWMTFYGDTPTTQILKSVVPHVTNLLLLAEHMKERKQDQAFAQSAAWRQGLDSLNEQYLNRLAQKEVKEPTEKEMEAYFKAHKGDFPKPMTLTAYRLLVTPRLGQNKKEKEIPLLAVQDEAQKIMERLKKGIGPETAIKEYADGPFKVELKRWKDIPYTNLAAEDYKFPPDLVTKVGQISSPVLVNDGGYAVYSITSKSDSTESTFAEAREPIRSRMKTERNDEKVNALGKTIRETMKINEKLAVIPADYLKPQPAPAGKNAKKS